MSQYTRIVGIMCHTVHCNFITVVLMPVHPLKLTYVWCPYSACCVVTVFFLKKTAWRKERLHKHITGLVILALIIKVYRPLLLLTGVLNHPVTVYWLDTWSKRARAAAEWAVWLSSQT